VNIIEREAFQEQVDQARSDRGKADIIANRTKKTITEKMEEDPFFYRKFSVLLNQAIDDYCAPRISDAEYLKRVPKRWGCAGTDGRIALTPELIHMPPRCIDYVVIHKICHLWHPNDGPQFHRLLTSLMPDWRTVKERLERSEI